MSARDGSAGSRTFLTGHGHVLVEIARNSEARIRDIAAVACDAAYIALAEALGCELLTGDVKLKNAAGHHATVTVIR